MIANLTKKGPATLKEECFWCQVSKWCTEFPEVCSATCTSLNICHIYIIYEKVESCWKVLIAQEAKLNSHLSGPTSCPPDR